MTTAVANQTQEEIVGAYVLLEKIAEGGMGTVHKGRSTKTDEVVAVKVVSASKIPNPTMLKRFQQEYHVAKAFDHPNLVKALDFGVDGDRYFLVMEFVDGESVGDVIQRQGKITVDEAVTIVTQIAEGLAYAHQNGIIHRDVKPDNILLSKSGKAKLSDMGLVKGADMDQGLTMAGRGLGTPNFMAPEQFRNAKFADMRCDVYSLAATLYMMVTGVLPFEGKGAIETFMKKINGDVQPPKKLNPEISDRLDWAIRRAMSTDPNERPGNCAEFIADLNGTSPYPPSSVKATASKADPGAAIWFVSVRDGSGAVHSHEGTVDSLRQRISSGEFGSHENVRVAKLKTGPYEPLREYAEFRDLALAPKPVAPPKPASSRRVRAKQDSVKSSTSPAQVKADAAATSASTAGEPAADGNSWKELAIVAVSILVTVIGYLLFLQFRR